MIWRLRIVQDGRLCWLYPELLHRLLAPRFGLLPSWVDQRPKQAGEDELEAWGDRGLASGSLEEVFRRGALSEWAIGFELATQSGLP